MEKELHKRFEETAEEYFESMCYDLTVHTEVINDFTEGAELGYKEAIKMACEWLKENLGYYNRNEVHIGKSYEQCVIDDFENDMNKLLEEK